MPSTTVFKPDYGDNNILDLGDHIPIQQYVEIPFDNHNLRYSPPSSAYFSVSNTGVYVSDSTATSITFVTQRGHPEAGAINFNFSRTSNALIFTIRSETTASSYFNLFAYYAAGYGTQTSIWTNVLLHAQDTFSGESKTSNSPPSLTTSTVNNPIYRIAPRVDQLRNITIAAPY